jgi:hypothetical protein
VLTSQRQREHDALFSLDAWDVELMEDEQWGRVLVAQRDFSPGEVVIRSGALLMGTSAAACVRMYRNVRLADVPKYSTIGLFIAEATKSPR